MARLISSEGLAVATVWQEARGEPFPGKVGVAEVILQRMARKKYSDGTVEGTVLRAYQFSGWNTTDPNRTPATRIDDDDPLVQECIKAWNEAVRGSDTTLGATHYVNLNLVRPGWVDSPQMKQTVQIASHTFFKEL